MTYAVIILSLLCGYLILHLFILRKSIKKLTQNFKQARGNKKGEQHVQIASPNKELEALAYEMNQYTKAYFSLKHDHHDALHAIQDEITNLSHDLRTPLTSILGYLDFLQEDVLSQEQEEALEVIRRRAGNLNVLIEELYEYARLKNDDASMNMEPLDLYRTVKEHILAFYNEFQQKGIHLELELPKEETPIWINGDLNYMNRVLTNLTSNTIKYSREQALISLVQESESVAVTYQSPRGELSDYDIVHLFDRFYKKDKIREKAESSGLGLTIAKLYVERMQGRIEARGDNKYLYITFVFPIINT